jgi:Organic solute transporter Ostalpha
MVPVYTLYSAICAIRYPASLYVEPLQEFYEAIALASIFNLFYNYMRPSLGPHSEYLDGGHKTSRKHDAVIEAAKGKLKRWKWFKVRVGSQEKTKS